jgi:hypothetical protein
LRNAVHVISVYANKMLCLQQCKSFLLFSGLEADICGSSKPDGVYTIKDRYFRIRYVPKRRQYITDIFTVVITAYGTGMYMYNHDRGFGATMFKLIIYIHVYICSYMFRTKPSGLLHFIAPNKVCYIGLSSMH